MSIRQRRKSSTRLLNQRMPGKVQELRNELDRLHHQAKSKGSVIGDGVTKWPAMI